MADQRAADAVKRIERAFARIQEAVSAAPAASQDSDEFRRLTEAHQALRSRVASAIGQIDRMIEGEARPDGELH